MGVVCDRCGKRTGDSWESQHTKVTMEAASCSVSYAKMAGENGVYLAQVSHPAFPLLEPQNVRMEIGYGTSYTICWECHRKFLEMVGDFLNLKQYAEFAKLSVRPACKKPQ